MLTYVIRRLLIIVPTVLVILVLAFILQSLAPGDQIAERLEIEGQNSHGAQKSYLTSYRALQKAYGLDGPQFFFSIRPSYFPDTLHRIYPKQKQDQLRSLLRQTKDWNMVSEFEDVMQNNIASLESKKGLKGKVGIELAKLSQDGSLSDVKARAEKIKNMISDSTHLFGTTSLLLEHIDGMKTSNAFSYPVFSWHGINNQFYNWITRVFSASNKSLIDGAPVLSKISKALKWTISMSLVTIVLIAILSMLLAFTKVYFINSLFDRISSAILYILLAVPTFWLASLLVVFFTTPEYGVWTDWFPSIGLKPSFVERSFLSELFDNIGQLVLPIICMSVLSMSYLTIQLRSDILETFSKPYMMMAKAKGLTEREVLKRHAIPNALIPYATILTGAIPGIFAGSVIIEVIFNIPGIGRLLLSSVQGSDWPVVFTIVIIISIATMVGYLIGDLILMRLFPQSKKSLLSNSEKMTAA